MLRYSIAFLVGAIVAGVFGFGLLTGTEALIAKVCFVISLLFTVAFLMYDPSRRQSEI